MIQLSSHSENTTFKSYLVKALILFVIYLISGKVGLFIQAEQSFATYIWLPTGVSCALLFLWGIKLWPAVYLAATITNITVGASLLTGMGIGLGNTLEAV